MERLVVSCRVRRAGAPLPSGSESIVQFLYNLVSGTRAGASHRLTFYRTATVKPCLLLDPKAVGVSLLLLIYQRWGPLWKLLVMMMMKKVMRLGQVWRRVRVRLFEDCVVACSTRRLHHFRFQAGSVFHGINVKVLFISVPGSLTASSVTS